MRATREDRTIDQVADLYGRQWHVRERRPSGHAFDLLLGWPMGAGVRGVGTVLTPALAEYLAGIERPRDIVLPIGRTAIRRLRAELDLTFDWARWWAARAGDLQTMTLEAFAARHECSIGAASQRRTALRTSGENNLRESLDRLRKYP